MFPELESQFLEYLDVQGSDVNIKNSLAQILTWAEDFIYSNYYVSIISRDVTETLDGSGTSRLFVTRGNIHEVTSLSVSDETIIVSDLKFSKNSIVYSDNIITAGSLNVDVVYKVGYATYSDVPASLVNALFVIGRKMHTDATKNFDSIALLSSDTKQSIKPLDSIPYLAENILQAYRIFKF